MTKNDTNSCRFTGTVIADPCPALTIRDQRLLVVRIWVCLQVQGRQLKTPVAVVMAGKLARAHQGSTLRGSDVAVVGQYRLIHWKDQQQPRVAIAAQSFKIIRATADRPSWNPLGSLGKA